MGADYTIWKPKTKEKFLLWTGEWGEILDRKDCVLSPLTVDKNYIINKLEYYHYGFPEKLANKILDFCKNDDVVLTNDCGEEYFDEFDVYNGIKDTYKVVGDRCCI